MKRESPQRRDDAHEPASKSQKKRAHDALKDLAESLVSLSSRQLDQLPLSAGLREAVGEASGLKRSAYQRQLRFVARRLADEDAAGLSAALERLRHGGREETAKLHRIERWRDRLLEEGGEALSAFIAEHPRTDRQQLRSLIRNALKEREQGSPPRAFRRLFALIREQME